MARATEYGQGSGQRHRTCVANSGSGSDKLRRQVTLHLTSLARNSSINQFHLVKGDSNCELAIASSVIQPCDCARLIKSISIGHECHHCHWPMLPVQLVGPHQLNSVTIARSSTALASQMKTHEPMNFGLFPANLQWNNNKTVSIWLGPIRPLKEH